MGTLKLAQAVSRVGLGVLGREGPTARPTGTCTTGHEAGPTQPAAGAGAGAAAPGHSAPRRRRRASLGFLCHDTMYVYNIILQCHCHHGIVLLNTMMMISGTKSY